MVTGTASYTVTIPNVAEPMVSLAISPAAAAVPHADLGQTCKPAGPRHYGNRDHGEPDQSASNHWHGHDSAGGLYFERAGRCDSQSRHRRGHRGERGHYRGYGNRIEPRWHSGDGRLHDYGYGHRRIRRDHRVRSLLFRRSQAVQAPNDNRLQYIAIAIGTTTTGATVNLTNQVAWTSSSAQIGTVGAATGLATGVGQGEATMTALYTPGGGGNVVNGTATFTVAGGTSETYTAVTILPNAQSLSVGQSSNFVALGTLGSNGLMVDVTNSPQVIKWSSQRFLHVPLWLPGNSSEILPREWLRAPTTVTAD